mgnify:CR=1 FL=1
MTSAALIDCIDSNSRGKTPDRLVISSGHSNIIEITNHQNLI